MRLLAKRTGHDSLSWADRQRREKEQKYRAGRPPWRAYSVFYGRIATFTGYSTDDAHLHAQSTATLVTCSGAFGPKRQDRVSGGQRMPTDR